MAAERCVFLKVQADDFWKILSENLELAMFIESIGEMRLREDIELIDVTQSKSAV